MRLVGRQVQGSYAGRWAHRSPGPGRIAGLIVALALVAGCAGAAGSRPGLEAAAAGDALGIDLRQTLVPSDRNGLTQLAALQTMTRDAQPTATLLTPAPAAARQAVIDARDALEKKQWSVLSGLTSAARPDPVLGMYPQYWWLRQQLHDTTQPIPQASIEEFLARTDNEYLADRIRGDWIVAAVQAGDFDRALQLAPIQTTTASVECSVILARHMMGQNVSADEALQVFAPNRACWTMLDQLAASGVVSAEHLSFELRAILETNQTSNAQRMAAILFDGKEMVQYAALMKAPRKWLDGRGQPTSQADTELVTIALSRLARSKDLAAEAAYIRDRWAAVLPARNLEWVWSQFGLIAALNVDLQAADWYRLSGNQRLTDYNHAWEVRAELRRHPIDWPRVQASIERMTTRQAMEPVWVYWHARALAAQGHHEQARKGYESIASGLDFYGQLANEELGHAPFIPAFPQPVTAQEFARAQAHPGLQRAIVLFDLGWRAEAVREWSFALRGMDDRALLAAAELARHEHIYDRVVNTSLLTRDAIDFSQRFVAPFEGRVSAKAVEVDLDPAWVYGLIRQESRFIMDARSRVGASGLMQLMPATAKWVAGKIGMTDFRPSSVNDFDVNTILGTRYLRIVLDGLDNSELLASAGYNAGPGRPRQWRAKLGTPVEGAIFAETIPFTETRLYVKNVMSNAVYYSMMFTGQPQSLKARLGTVSPAGTRTVARP